MYGGASNKLGWGQLCASVQRALKSAEQCAARPLPTEILALVFPALITHWIFSIVLLLLFSSHRILPFEFSFDLGCWIVAFYPHG